MVQTRKTLFDPLPENLFRQPIDYLLADHHRQTKLCDLLDTIRADPDSDELQHNRKAILDYLAVELPRHMADEEDLFASIVENCAAGDTVGALIELLRDEHARNGDLLGATKEALASMESLEVGEGLPPDVAVFAETKRRHIRLENELLLPLARVWLNPDALRALGERMASRRGVPYPL